MILKDILDYFNIEDEFPDYLLSQSFNKIFLEGEFTKKDNNYEIVITTRQDVTHHMYLKPDDEFPVVIISELPNGSLNGMKFGRSEDDVAYINEL